MPTVTLTVGVPGSGKTTWAREEANKDPNIMVVSRDDIRATYKWRSGVNEDRVTRIHRAMIEAALLEGMDVIVADTNLNPEFRKQLIKFCNEHRADVVLKPFHVDLDTAIRWDLSRPEAVGPDVVNKFYKMMQEQAKDLQGSQFFLAENRKFYSHSGKRQAVVCDIDGTLARHVSRSPYDESKVLEDEPIQDVINIVKTVGGAYPVIFVSGRSSRCQRDTLTWLTWHFGFSFIERSALLMRGPDDSRPDYMVKNDIYDKIISEFDIVMVFDDRDQVVRHLRARGITVAQVAPGRF